MTWVKIDDMLPVQPEITPLSDSAFRLYISAICWANVNQTGGNIPAGVINDLGMPVTASRPAAKELTAAGLWARTGNGWQILTQFGGTYPDPDAACMPHLALVPPAS